MSDEDFLPDEGAGEAGVTDAGPAERQSRRLRVPILVGAVAAGILGAGGVIAYLNYTRLDLTLQELRTAYASEQTAAKRLARKAEEQSKALEQAQARVKALEEGQKTSQEEATKLEAKSAKLETTVQGLQTAYASEQTAARGLAQRADELSRALEQAQGRVRFLEVSLKTAEQQKNEGEVKIAKLEAALQGLQTAYAGERATAKQLSQKTEELAKALEQVRMKAREEKPGDLAVLNYTLGTNYTQRGMNEEALKAFQAAVKFDPNHAEAHFELGRLYLSQFDNKQAAVPHLRRYLVLKPESREAERVKGWLLTIEKEVNAEREREGWGKMEPKQGLKRIFE